MEKENEKKKENIGGGGIVIVDPKPSKGIVSRMVDAVEKLIVWSMYDSSKPQHYLSGNFAPAVEETPPCKNLPIKGFLPVRNPLPISFFFSFYNFRLRNSGVSLSFPFMNLT